MLNLSKKQKLNLSQLKVQSFVTTLEDQAQIKGVGGTGGPQSIRPQHHSTCDAQLERAL